MISRPFVSNLFNTLLPKARILVPALGKQLRKSNFSTLFGNRNQNPPALSSQIEGLSRLVIIKQYLYEYGFMDTHPPYTDNFDGNVTKALKEYQMFFNLSITGWIDNSTLQQMSLPRCGVHDMIPTLTRLQNLSFPNGK